MKKLLSILSLLATSSAAIAEPNGMPPYTLDPGPHAGNWESTLTGTGQSDHEFDRSNFGITGSVGRYLTKNVVLTFKQGLQFGEPQRRLRSMAARSYRPPTNGTLHVGSPTSDSIWEPCMAPG